MNNRKKWSLLGIVAASVLSITLMGRQNLRQRSQSPVSANSLLGGVNRELLDPANPSLSPQDFTAIQETINQQLTAFQEDDAETAFSFASPAIQAQFQSADQFMNMVKAEYLPVYRPQSITFDSLEILDGRPVQAVILLGPAGEWVTAYYQMEQQADETWRIAGCVLFPLEGETI